jgi:hypothetical protein
MRLGSLFLKKVTVSLAKTKLCFQNWWKSAPSRSAFWGSWPAENVFWRLHTAPEVEWLISALKKVKEDFE